MKKIGIGIAVALAAALILVLLAHTPFVRGAALRYALATVQRNYGLTLQAERLDYNLATLRVGLAGAAPVGRGLAGRAVLRSGIRFGPACRPACFLGNVAFKDISVTNGRVFVHRRADGSSNLPQSEDSPGNDPPALHIDRIDVPRLAIDVRDEQADLALQVPAIGIRAHARRGIDRAGDSRPICEFGSPHDADLAD